MRRYISVEMRVMSAMMPMVMPIMAGTVILGERASWRLDEGEVGFGEFDFVDEWVDDDIGSVAMVVEKDVCRGGTRLCVVVWRIDRLDAGDFSGLWNNDDMEFWGGRLELDMSGTSVDIVFEEADVINGSIEAVDEGATSWDRRVGVDDGTSDCVAAAAAAVSEGADDDVASMGEGWVEIDEITAGVIAVAVSTGDVDEAAASIWGTCVELEDGASEAEESLFTACKVVDDRTTESIAAPAATIEGVETPVNVASSEVVKLSDCVGIDMSSCIEVGASGILWTCVVVLVEVVAEGMLADSMLVWDSMAVNVEVVEASIWGIADDRLPISVETSCLRTVEVVINNCVVDDVERLPESGMLWLSESLSLSSKFLVFIGPS
jgi:hypothetical protein